MSTPESCALADVVAEYYGRKLQGHGDFVCFQQCSQQYSKDMSGRVRAIVPKIHSDVSKRFYGCGNVFSDCLEGSHVLDLGSGAGRDCFILSNLVGPTGHVVGIDISDDLLSLSRSYIDYHMEAFQYERPNVEFRKAYLEDLLQAGIQDASYDFITSNCVFCTCKNKRVVLQEAYRALREGGELYLSDMYADRRLPDTLSVDTILWAEGYAGAMWWENMLDMAREVGFLSPRLVTATPLSLQDPDRRKLVGDVQYTAAAYKLFKPISGQKQGVAGEVTYLGTMDGVDEFKFDVDYTFKIHEPQIADSELMTILKNSRYKPHFQFNNTAQQPITSQDRKVTSDPFALIQSM